MSMSYKLTKLVFIIFICVINMLVNAYYDDNYCDFDEFSCGDYCCYDDETCCDEWECC